MDLRAGRVVKDSKVQESKESRDGRATKAIKGSKDSKVISVRVDSSYPPTA